MTQATLRAGIEQADASFRLLVENVRDYGIFMLDPTGVIVSWNAGAERIKGYAADEIIGRHFSTFYPAEDNENGKPAYELREAAAVGRFEDEGWRLRKDGTRFWANVIITALRDETGHLVGYGKVTRDLTERRKTEEALRQANQELAATTYAIAHDLRSPLRALDGYSLLLLEGFADRLDERGISHLERIRSGAQRMGQLLDGLLALSRIGRGELLFQPLNLATLARSVMDDLRRFERDRQVAVIIADDLLAYGDPRLITVVLQNLLGNAWKFTRGRIPAEIVLGGAAQGDGRRAFYVRDNGVGFDPSHADQLFRPFHRLHADAGFEGTGIGLATVRRIVERHGGTVWAEGASGSGATFWFTLSVRPSHGVTASA